MGKRFERIYVDFIKDNQTQKVYGEFQLDDLVNLLNEQDEKIKELGKIKNQNKVIWDENDKAVLCGDCYCLNNDVRKLVEENRQLKQSQNSKAIEVLEKLKNDLFDYSVTINIMEHRAIRLCNIRKVIDNQTTELRGG